MAANNPESEDGSESELEERTTISVSRRTKRRLTLRKQRGDSYESVVSRLLDDSQTEEDIEEIRALVEESPLQL
jgi:hypothetical protein